MILAPIQPQSEIIGRKLGDWFVVAVCFLLLGYALMGKSFAYLGAPPLFVGELVMMLGLAAVVFSRNLARTAESWLFWILLAFMGWCLTRVLPFIGRYKIDAIRDAMVWGYGLYAVILGVVLTERPERLRTLLKMARWFAPLVLILGPAVTFTTRVCEDGSIMAPWAAVPIVLVKGGDFMVHLTIAVTMIAAGMSFMPMGWLVVFSLTNILLNVQGRAGLVAFVMGMFIFMMLRPANRLIWWLIALACLGLVMFWATDLHFKVPNDAHREISFDQLAENMKSIMGSSNKGDMDGTKEWRIKWWTEIVHYTFGGEYFWGGKGFGVNLADDDGFQVKDKDQSQLRSPHNGHLCILARAGVPGIVLWVTLLVAWLISICNGWYISYRNHHGPWSSLFLVLLVAQVGMIINASFDVYLEGPMGGIWFWSVFGIGMASVWIYKHHPETLLAPEPARVASVRQPAFGPVAITLVQQQRLARMAQMNQLRQLAIERLATRALPAPGRLQLTSGPATAATGDQWIQSTDRSGNTFK